MKTKLVKVSDLKLGSVIANDIKANTQYPIIYKNTKITREHLPVLKAFQISQVTIISSPLGSNKIENEDDGLIPIEQENIIDSASIMPFERKYIDVVNKIKKEFINWESGSKVNITKVRTYILPLIDLVLENRDKVFTLNEFSTSEDYIYHHSVAISLICAVIAQKMGYSKGDILQIAIAGAVADCGMAKINKKIREKTGPLTEYEFKEIQEHPYYSLQMINSITILKQEMKIAVYQHHERLDGSGYPRGEKGSKISIFSHIIAVADVFHAMTCERIYQSKESPFKVLEMIRETEFGKFNIQVVQALMTCVTDLPLGSKVELSNGLEASIIFTNKTSPTRPVIKVVESNEIIDLSKYRNIYIERLILER
ncbi:HD-GYP domain-containing protein [uncultured Rummeliibacillus sp.]|uniref:HD-GYP domain-containing protein n=1 Tax=uncultured Rummeliibacillus sp. TaxID=762292 RepID=UPI0026089630|nr:HD-GYP domain-containing protein [uncultured Rummeliibacillus sp.]